MRKATVASALASSLLLVVVLAGHAGANHLTCFNRTTTIDGTSASETINGGAGNDVIHARGGVIDEVYGLDGNDRICGGNGSDILDGGEGNDRLKGGGLNDSLVGGDGEDVLKGGAYDDYLFPGSDDDTVDGGDGTSDDVSYGTSPSAVTVDLLAGIATGDGTDTLIGIEGIIGSTHDDTLIGDAGDNVISGGAGNDTCTGGGGNDTFSNCETIN